MIPPSEIAAYSSVTAALDPYLPHILDGTHVDDAATRSRYAAEISCPDLRNTLARMARAPIDYSLNQNVRALGQDITIPAVEALNRALGGGWMRSGAFWYPAVNGWMDWHSNHKAPGYRIYLVWCAEGGKSCFLYSPDGGRTMQEHYEPAGWSVNVFIVSPEPHPFWHAITSGGTDRISFGFRPV
jgi:hypothetical protein